MPEANVRILVIDDDPIDREMLQRVVRKQALPYVMDFASTYGEGRGLLQSRIYDLALIDHNLGDGRGLDLLDERRGTPAIIVTGEGDEDVAVEAIERGAVDYIVKDVGQRYLKTLHLRVASVLARAHEAKRLADLEEFARVASHDLQSPVRAISAYAEFLIRKHDRLSDEQRLDYAERIRRSGLRLHRLLEDMLRYTLADTRQRVEPVDLNDVVRDVLADLEHRLQEVGGRITVAELPTVSGDREALEHVVQNLVENALKYRSEEPLQVSVSANPTRDESTWTVSVEDNGVGIEAEYRTQVFDIFQRLGTDGDDEGTGIGLSVCRKIIEGHGGRIWVEPAAGGHGSRFAFTLPREAPGGAG